MRLNRLFVLLVLPLTIFSGCGGGGGSSASTPKTLVSLAVTPTNPSLAAGTSQQFSATGTFSDNTVQDLTSSVNWNSSSVGVATIDSSGRALAATAGTTKITAASGTVTGAANLTVSSATLLSLAIMPADSSVTQGAAQQFSATGTFSDNSSQDITATVAWSSSAPSVATISSLAGSSGRASSLAVGSTTITAVSGGRAASTTLTVTRASSAQVNVVPITVNGALCSSATSSGYFNKPCVSVTVCNPDGSNCQVINDILLDTGSYGLRIFQSALGTLTLSQESAGSGSLAECVEYADGSANWGAVQVASVILGGEPAIQVPIQVINSSFGNLASKTLRRLCPGALATPQAAGFTGILGVGLLTQDCGADCVSSPDAGNYYACSGTSCSGTTVALANQVTNPVALLPTDNNGVLVQLPNVPLGGMSSANGSLTLGIGTRSNNGPAGATAYPANGNAEFTCSFQGSSSDASFIDSGSNALYFPASTGLLPQDSSGFFAPSLALGSAQSFSATNSGYLGTPSGTVWFNIGNFDSLFNSGNNVFSDIGGYQAGGFDWGLPFFFGRNVFIGFDGTSSSLGRGPYWAY